MTVKTTDRKEGSGDLLGLVTFGSIVANIWQIASNPILPTTKSKFLSTLFNYVGTLLSNQLN